MNGQTPRLQGIAIDVNGTRPAGVLGLLCEQPDALGKPCLPSLAKCIEDSNEKPRSERDGTH
jgi:hypothetical protein